MSIPAVELLPTYALSPRRRVPPSRWMQCEVCGYGARVLSGQLRIHCCPVNGKTYTAHNVPGTS